MNSYIILLVELIVIGILLFFIIKETKYQKELKRENEEKLQKQREDELNKSLTNIRRR